MEDLIIEPYQPKRDKNSIRAMLCGDEQIKELLKCERMFPDGIFVARYNGITVGFLSIDGIKRKAQTMIYVSEECRRKGIGTALMAKVDHLLTPHKIVERSMGGCMDGDRSTLQFLYKNGYYISWSSHIMEREGGYLPEQHISVRPYEDDDYETCHVLIEVAFYKLHDNLGMLPTYYFPPNENERKRMFDNKSNIYVLLVEGEIAGVGHIDGNELSHVSVRHDLQSQGYGRPFVSFLVNEIMRRGNTIVQLGVVKGNYARKLYESLGFNEKSLYHWLTKYYRPDTRMSSPPSEILSVESR